MYGIDDGVTNVHLFHNIIDGFHEDNLQYLDTYTYTTYL